MTTTTTTFGIKAHRSATSVFGWAERWTRWNGVILTGSREEMEARAKELNDKKVPNTWYSAEEVNYGPREE